MDEIKDTLDRYVNRRIETGGFMRAVLENDLFGAVAKADLRNGNRLPEIVRYIYNNLPIGCYGSKENVNNWLKGEEL